MPPKAAARPKSAEPPNVHWDEVEEQELGAAEPSGALDLLEQQQAAAAPTQDDTDELASGGYQSTSRTGRTEAAFRRPSSVSRFSTNPYAMEFYDWVQTVKDGWDRLHQMFVKEDYNPAGEQRRDRSHTGINGIDRKRWVELMISMGYPSEVGASLIFEEIGKEIQDPKLVNSDPLLLKSEPVIHLSQLLRFHKRAGACNSTLGAGDDQSPRARFCKLLVKSHGAVLRAWRMELDKRGTGRVAYLDFTNACRKLGLGPQGKLALGNMRSDRLSPMELHELEPVEAENLEKFAEILWTKCGFDMNKAWRMLDTTNQRTLSFEEFSAGVKKLGFTGDARLLFRGLDVSGLGRVKFEELEYVGRISRICNRRGVMGSKGSVADLIKWMQREFGGAEPLFAKLGLEPGSNTELAVGDLAARLTALGFDGNATDAASKAARSEGGTSVTAESLASLLCGVRSQVKTKTRAKSARGVRDFNERPDWYNIVLDLSEINQFRHRIGNVYFTPYDILMRHEEGRVAPSGMDDPTVENFDPRAVYVCSAQTYTPKRMETTSTGGSMRSRSSSRSRKPKDVTRMKLGKAMEEM